MGDASRTRELLPSVLLTLLSVVQALALEALWSAIRENPAIFQAGPSGWVFRLQVVAIFQGIVVIWLFYIGVVMRYSWIPRTRDSISPFVLGAGELSMVQLMGPDLLQYWFWALAGVFAFSAWISTSMFLAAFADPTNPDAAIETQDPLAGRWSSWLAAGAIAICGGLVVAFGGDGAVAIACLVFANLLLLAQGFVIQHFWRLWAGTLER